MECYPAENEQTVVIKINIDELQKNRVKKKIPASPSPQDKYSDSIL